MTQSNTKPDPIRLFATQTDWTAWLEKNHGKSEGVWLRLAKKGSRLRSVTYAEALEIALCYGWIDGQKRGESDEAWLQRFLPRAVNSIWSRINRESGRSDQEWTHERCWARRDSGCQNKREDGMRPMTRPEPPQFPRILRQRWARVRGPGSSLHLSMAPTGMQCCFGFRQ